VLRGGPLILNAFCQEEFGQVPKDLLVSTFNAVGFVTIDQGQTVVNAEPLVN
jgi:hypothetical protein